MNWQKRWGRFKYLLLVFLSVYLISCSTAKYKIGKVYIGGDKQCIENCKKEKIECENRCKLEYEKCIDQAYNRAKQIYSLLEKRYKENLEIYNTLYRDYLYHYDQWFSRYRLIYDTYLHYKTRCLRDRKDKYSCERYRQLSLELEHLRILKPRPPDRPFPPNFEKILEKEKKACQKDCTCTNDFDICFSNCGGKIDVKKICIKNCKKDKN
ncbi:MAG: hypothetical protein GXO22_00940 [Aquificae bacterium]|nr:hypothetical protein [Aquificota bacterium]